MTRSNPARDPKRDERNRRGSEEPDRGIRKDDAIVDEASEDSFPGSDPPSYTGTTTSAKPTKDKRR